MYVFVPAVKSSFGAFLTIMPNRKTNAIYLFITAKEI